VSIVPFQAFVDSSLVEALLRDMSNARRICRSVWQQSVALFDELWEQKLINFNYCLQQH